LGTNSDRKCAPWRTKPMTVTPRNTTNAIAKVTMMWLVGVKEKGTIPSRLQNRMKTNSVSTNGKYFLPASPTLSRTMPATNS